MDESGSRFTKIRRRLEEEDRISNMPDDILVLILNLMTTEEGKEGEIEQVVRTSVLSRRWRFLWKYYSLKSLTFTPTKRDNRYFNYYDSVCEAAHRGFVDRVNLILALPVVGNTIDDFNLTFCWVNGQTYWRDHLPRWISFALQKRVKRLSINLRGSSPGCFTFDDKIIRNHNVDSLVSLCLFRVDVTGEFLEHLLTICGSLEQLSVSESRTLVHFSVSGPCLKLKYLKIHCCLNLRRLHICRVNLVSFVYNSYKFEKEAAVVIEDAPSLVNARLGGFRGDGEIAKVLSHLPHLQTLGLAFDSFCSLGCPPVIYPKLMNLVKVELDLFGEVFGSTICASLLVSCPSMSELVLTFESLDPDINVEKKVERLEHGHECLKVVELVGFIGCQLDIGVALYLIENTLSLETILVNTRLPYEVKSAERERARAIAKEHLGTRLLNTSTKLVLI